MLTTYIQTKGYTYEKYILNFITNAKNEYDNAWLFKDTPEYIISKTLLYKSYDLYSKYRNSDIGADIVAIKNNIIYFIQCKNYDNVISINDLSTFYFLLYEFQLNGIVYYNGRLSERINNLSQGKVPFIHVPFNNQLIYNNIFQNNDYIINEPKEYQLEAVNLLKNKHRSILSFPCGMGKTYTSYLISKSYDNIILLSPTRTLAEELLKNMDAYFLNKYNPILISMDGSRDPIYIKSILKKFNIISVTYNSVDILNKIIDVLDNVYIIIDEYHNLSEADINNNQNEINKILESKYPILFLSATPKKNNNIKYFGDTIFKYSWSLAISNSYICDFKIILPEKKDYLNIFKNLLVNISYDKLDIKLANKAYFLLRSLLYEGSRKCIVYLTSIEISSRFKNIVEWMQKILNCNINQYQINCQTSKTKRAEYISKFKTDTNISLILNVQILNEGINIPVCDSVYIIKPNDNLTNLIQRMSRANRILDDKINCKIYLWCSEKKTEKIINYINEQTNEELKDKIYKYNFTNNNTNIERYKTKIIINDKIKYMTNIFNIYVKNANILMVIDINNNIWYGVKDIIIFCGYKSVLNVYRLKIPITRYVNIKHKYINYSKCIQPATSMINTDGLIFLLNNSKKSIANKIRNDILNNNIIIH